MHPQRTKEYGQEHSRASVRPYRKYLMGADGTYRQVGLSGVFRVVSNHIPHGRRSRLLLAPLLVLQTRAGGPPGHAEDILRRTLALVFNQGVYIFGLSMTSPIDASIVTTTLPIVTMIVAAIYLKEPVTNKKVLGIFVGAMGAFILIMSSQTTGSRRWQPHRRLAMLDCPNQLLYLSDRIQRIVAEVLSHYPEQMDVCLCLHVLHPVLLPRRGCHTMELKFPLRHCCKRDMWLWEEASLPIYAL